MKNEEKTSKTFDIYEQINFIPAWKLTDTYISSALQTNGLILSMVVKYNIAPQINQALSVVF